jgi:hypothetical protein
MCYAGRKMLGQVETCYHVLRNVNFNFIYIRRRRMRMCQYVVNIVSITCHIDVAGGQLRRRRQFRNPG